MTETDPVSKASCFKKLKMIDNVQNVDHIYSNIPLSETFRISQYVIQLVKSGPVYTFITLHQKGLTSDRELMIKLIWKATQYYFDVNSRIIYSTMFTLKHLHKGPPHHPV